MKSSDFLGSLMLKKQQHKKEGKCDQTLSDDEDDSSLLNNKHQKYAFWNYVINCISKLTFFAVIMYTQIKQHDTTLAQYLQLAESATLNTYICLCTMICDTPIICRGGVHARV